MIVSSRAAVEAGIVVRPAYVLISIRDPGLRPPRIPRQSGLRGLLSLAFHDAEPGGMDLPTGVVLMREGQAEQVCQFVRQWETEAGAVVVHCEQGASRSPAVAAALAKCLGLDEGPFRRFCQPNPYVYRLVTDAWTRTSPVPPTPPPHPAGP